MKQEDLIRLVHRFIMNEYKHQLKQGMEGATARVAEALQLDEEIVCEVVINELKKLKAKGEKL